MSSYTDVRENDFKFQRALLVTKLSRYEFEQHKHQNLTEPELEQVLRNRGTDYDTLIEYHKLHKSFEAQVADSFRQFDKEIEIVNRSVNLMLIPDSREFEVKIPQIGDLFLYNLISKLFANASSLLTPRHSYHLILAIHAQSVLVHILGNLIHASSIANPFWHEMALWQDKPIARRFALNDIET